MFYGHIHSEDNGALHYSYIQGGASDVIPYGMVCCVEGLKDHVALALACHGSTGTC